MKEITSWPVTNSEKLESLFRPEKVGFMAWEAEVKVPGKAKWWMPVRAWTRNGVLRKAHKCQTELYDEYMASRGESKALPDVGPDSDLVAILIVHSTLL